MPNSSYFPPILVLYVHRYFLGFFCAFLPLPTEIMIIPVISLQILMNVAPIMEDVNTIVTILLGHLSATVNQATGWEKTD